MLLEWIDCLRMTCAPGARALGLAQEAAAINARHRRQRRSWSGHLEACAGAIEQAARLCHQKRRVLVVGAGACLDVPVGALLDQFGEVVLTDVVVGPAMRRWERRGGGRVRVLAWDATGALGRLAQRRGEPWTADAVADCLHKSDPGHPGCDEADLVISANCLSQLGLVPADALSVADWDEDFPRRCTRIAAMRHLRWLSERRGARLLLSDVARLNVAPDGRVLERETIFGEIGLRAPDRSWNWRIAPIPEISRHWHRVHEVGAWLDQP